MQPIKSKESILHPVGKLIVCGDSFMSPVVTHPGTHFSELVAKELGYELTAYSRGGMSNGGIAVQIESAIKSQPDLILVGLTYYDRIEYPMNMAPDSTHHEFTIEDISYTNSHSVSSRYSWLNKSPRLISTTIAQLLTDESNWLNHLSGISIKKKALNFWLRYLYDPDWKRQTDMWMMYAVLHRLHLSGIPYLLCMDPMGVRHTCPWLLDSVHNLVDNVADIIFPMPEKPPEPAYHTTAETQQAVAKFVLAHLSDNLNIPGQ